MHNMNNEIDLTHNSSGIIELARQARSFLDERIIPNEPVFLKNDKYSSILKRELEVEAREKGIWGVFYPRDCGGKIDSLYDYFLIAEQECRSEYSSEILGVHSSLDARMFHEYGNEVIKQEFLQSLSSGNAYSGYAMTDKDRAGSIPSHIETSAILKNGNWIINGKKWFISNAVLANFFTVVVKTSTDNPVDEQFSMIVVPVKTKGVLVAEEIDVLGKLGGQGELHFDQVHVPEKYMLGARGEGLAIMRKRLHVGRLLRSMQWLGLSQRCFDLMGQRVFSKRGVVSRLADKQLIRSHFVEVYQAISSARELIKKAALSVDLQRGVKPMSFFENHSINEDCDILVNSAKLSSSKAISLASDLAVQIYGAEGLRADNPLSGVFRIARTTRILDGADEALINSVGKQLISKFDSRKAGDLSFDFSGAML